MSRQTTSSRRHFLGFSSAAVAVGAAGSVVVPQSQVQAADTPATQEFRYCLNTSTIRGQKLGIVDQVKVAAKAGYDGIEIWLNDVDEFLKSGGKLEELRQIISSEGLVVESAIAFANWIVDDDAAREKGLENARSDMAKVRALGGRRIAAPPAGATDKPGLDLRAAAARYRRLLEIGAQHEVVPQLEVWGFSKNLAKLSEVLFIAAEAGHPDACVLPDVYHLYKGGNDFSMLPLLSGTKIHVFHMNDYPASPPRETINDAARVYPTDGIAPLGYIFHHLRKSGFNGVLSLELFNPEYWKQDALEVAKTGLAKMKAAAQLPA
jgi:sugar phosphate isomerase/epimerase